jgi:hypothetical protein
MTDAPACLICRLERELAIKIAHECDASPAPDLVGPDEGWGYVPDSSSPS